MAEVGTEQLTYKNISSPEHGKKRLRINKKTGDHSFLVSRFNDACETNKLNGPFRFIAKDENSFSNKTRKEVLNDTCHWLLKHSPHEKLKVNNKSYISKKCNLDTDVFFVLVENEEYSDLFPISSWHTFETDVSEKNLNKIDKEEIIEKWKKEKNEKQKKIEEILERLRIKEEMTKSLPHRANEIIAGNRKTRGSASDDEDDDDEIHIEKLEKKKIRNLLKLKRGDDKDEIDYVNSALSIAAVRKNIVDWDYSDDGKKSDDEDLLDVASPVEDVDDDEDNDNSEDDEYVADSNLTCYGQAVRTLLKQQIDDEEDEELKQYSDDDDDEEDEEEEEGEEEEENEEPEENVETEGKKGKKRKRKESPEEKRKTKKNKTKQKSKNKKRKKRKQGDSDDSDTGDDSESDDDSDSDGSGSDDGSEDDSVEESEEDSDEESEEESDEERNKKKKHASNISGHTFNEAIKEKLKKNKLQITKDNCAKIIYTIIEKNNGKMEISLLLNILNIKEKNQSFILVQKAIKLLCNISSQMRDNKKVKMVSIKQKYLKK